MRSAVDKAYIENLLPGVLGQLQQQNRTALYFNNPILWAKDVLNIDLWDIQGDIGMALKDHKNIAVKAGHEVGKSFLMGILICWWIDTRWQLPGGCFVVSTAPSTKQINAIVWKEVRLAHQLSRERHAEYQRRVQQKIPLGEYQYSDHALPGYITSDAHWRLVGGVELGYGSKPPDSKDDTMSGIHARYVLAIGDEAVGLSEALIGDLGNITSNATSRRMIVMNPTNPLSYAGRIFKEKTGTWALYTISVFDSPNFHGGDLCGDECPRREQHKNLPPGLGFPDFVLEKLVDQTYVDDMQRDHGVESPTYISRVLGEFAWDAGATLLTMEDMAVGLDTEIEPSYDAERVLGVDVSRSKKGDMNTVYFNEEGRVRFVDAWNEKNAMVTAQKIHDYAMEKKVSQVRIDGSGLGGPIADRVRELSGWWDGTASYITLEMMGGDPSPDKDRYYNRRSWWYVHFGMRLRAGEIDIDEKDKKLQEELLGIETKFPRQGVQKLLIESKEDMRKRGVGSPDYADACIYATADVTYLLEQSLAGLQPGQNVELEYETPSEYAGGYGLPA